MVRALRMLLLGPLLTSVSPAQDFWQSASTGLTEPTVRTIVVNQNGVLFTGTAAGAFRSTDHGDSWTYLSETGDATVQSAAVGAGGRIYGGTEHGVLSSTDDGDSWTPLTNGFPDTLVTAIATDENDNVFAGTDLGGLFRSTDQGGVWTKLTTGLTSDNLTALASLGAGVILAGTDGEGIYRSTDGGDSWLPAIVGLTDTYVYALAARPGGTVFAGSATGGVYRSTDLGLTWSQVNDGLTTLTVVTLAVHPSGDVFAGTSGGGVFRSGNDGGTWDEVNGGLGDLSVYALAVDSSGYLFAGTIAAGDFRSVLPVVTGVRDAALQPERFSLGQNYPNPFNPETRITITLPDASQVTLTVYDALGRRVALLADGERMRGGSHELRFDASEISSGVYFYRLSARAERSGIDGRAGSSAETFVSVRKMLVIR